MPKRICFVAMPFGGKDRDSEKHELWSELYFDHIKPTVEDAEHDFRCIRADEIARPGSIIRDVVDNLATADVVIVEMTDQNPNVFYELGVRHALSNRTILIAQSPEDVPFDLRDCRTIIYRFTPRGVGHLKVELKKYIEETLDSPDLSDNPVQTYLNQGRPLLGTQVGVEQDIVEMQTRYRDLHREFEEIKHQNYRLASTVAELRDVWLGSEEVETQRMDLTGTWLDTAFHNEIKYAIHLGDHVILAYEGWWPGVIWGKIQDGLLRFSWTRLDNTAQGKGYFRINETQNMLDGGIWFDDTDVDQMLARDKFLETHTLTRTSIQIDQNGKLLVEGAERYLRSRGITDLSAPDSVGRVRA